MSRPAPFDLAVASLITVNSLAFAIGLAALWQEGWPAAWPVIATAGATAFGISLALFLIQDGYRWGWQAFAAGLFGPAAAVWIAVAGSFSSWRNFWWDVAALSVALLLAEVVSRWWVERSKNPHYATWPHLRRYPESILAMIFFWLLATSFSFFRGGTQELDPKRLERMVASALTQSVVAERSGEPAPADWPGGYSAPPHAVDRAEEPLRIGLALSGGGYRAAVFHAGVLQGLEELGVRVSNLSVVSGGAIIGSFYAAGGDPARFVEAVVRGDFDLKRELLLAHNLVRLPFPGRVPGTQTRLMPLFSFDRLDVQSGLVRRRLLGQTSLEELATVGPELMIAATDLHYGGQIGLLPDGILRLGGPADASVYRRDAFDESPRFSLPERVAVSGAFPGAFPGRPYRVSLRPLGGGQWIQKELLLVDGGARDNSGLELLLAASRLAAEESGSGVSPWTMPGSWFLDVVLSSDAGATLAVAEGVSSGLAELARTVSVTGIPMRAPRKQPELCAPKVAFSPGRYFMTLDQEFGRSPGTQSFGSVRFPVIDPLRYDLRVLDRLVDLLLEVEQRNEARDLLRRFVQGWSEHRMIGSEWAEVYRDAKGQCLRGAREGSVPGVCAGVQLGRLLQESVASDLLTFRGTPTLEDRLSRENAESLERLGRALVLLESPRLDDAFRRAAECRQKQMTVEERELGEATPAL